MVGASTIREVDPDTGEVLRTQAVPDVFAEGMTVVGDEILQITWTEEVAYRYDRDTFDLITTHSYEGQGWGLCEDGSRLVMPAFGAFTGGLNVVSEPFHPVFPSGKFWAWLLGRDAVYRLHSRHLRR